MPKPYRSIPAAVTLFFLAPIVAEFLLGDFPATWLPLLIILAPMYGGGALLIRELTRRTGRGWPTILLLGCRLRHHRGGLHHAIAFQPPYLGLHPFSPTPGSPRSASAPGGPSSCSTSTPSGASASPSR